MYISLWDHQLIFVEDHLCPCHAQLSEASVCCCTKWGKSDQILFSVFRINYFHYSVFNCCQFIFCHHTSLVIFSSSKWPMCFYDILPLYQISLDLFLIHILLLFIKNPHPFCFSLFVLFALVQLAYIHGSETTHMHLPYTLFQGETSQNVFFPFFLIYHVIS